MINPTYKWQFVPQVEDADFTKIAKKAGLGSEVARLLFERGIQDEASLKRFLTPSLEDLHDPYLLHDMEKAVERIRRAIELGESILVYGDYDADGMTSASIIKESLEQLGAECQVYLPNRFTDGYGPNASVYKYFRCFGSKSITDYYMDTGNTFTTLDLSKNVNVNVAFEKMWNIYKNFDGIYLSMLTNLSGTDWEKAKNKNSYCLEDEDIKQEFDYESQIQ